MIYSLLLLVLVSSIGVVNNSTTCSEITAMLDKVQNDAITDHSISCSTSNTCADGTIKYTLKCSSSEEIAGKRSLCGDVEDAVNKEVKCASCSVSCPSKGSKQFEAVITCDLESTPCGNSCHSSGGIPLIFGLFSLVNGIMTEAGLGPWLPE